MSGVQAAGKMSQEEIEKRNKVFQKVANMNMQFESLEAQVKGILHQNLMKSKEDCYNNNKQSADKFAECSHKLIEKTRLNSAEMKFRINFFQNKMEKCLKMNSDAAAMLACTEECEKVYHHIFAKIQDLQ